ncbi:peptide n-glycanase, putative [Perkinsus marinus ATCC 50983]|uniref:Peptide n-glycanase, putative n=1 Tax=Perkinsus marinus (strain ATCC 50983 / TXsc) TaxID=423536 RepID=C5L4F8_PERM5|nr:peptide n-glycanase, putative [Perkinsus marinus ATCC 50983]EER08395.1 peptide n-glycanase, putative [Perkinsus marinus ATCC 50983]|eukprot:XP_002776579.1 peptide n-glycanase, putative [Perkinsus marinus ATCC 50983]
MSGFLSRANLPLVTKSGQRATVPDDQTVVCLYFSAHWCPPCRQFTPMLKQFYQLARSVGMKIEVVFVSSDRSEAEMLDYFRTEHGDWLALSYSDRSQAQWLGQNFGVRGIPSLKVLNYDGESCVADGRSEVMRALQGGPSGMVNCLQSWKALSGVSAATALDTSKLSLQGKELALKLLNNVLGRPSEAKFRTIKLHNKTISQAGLGSPEGEAVMTACGWQKVVGSDPGYTVPPVNDAWLRASRGALERAIAREKATVVTASMEPSGAVRAKISYATHAEEIEIETVDLSTLRALVSSLFEIEDENSVKMFSEQLRAEGEVCQEDLKGLALAGAAGKEVEIVVLTSLSPSNPCPAKLVGSDSEANGWAQEVRAGLTAQVESKAGGVGVKDSVRQQIVNNAMHVQLYEIPSNQQAALSVVPVVELHKKAVSRCRALVEEDGSPYYAECLLEELVQWFKKSFFKWMDKPECDACGCKNTESQGTTTPTPDEAKGMASRVEVYRCTVCGSVTRYPRYNHPVALLHTRSGRCGEWANCFCLVARSVGFEVRHVIDATDHVWSEVWVDRQQRWVHVDPCEAVIDAPLMYESGWKKSLSWVWATSRDGCRDVTPRYTRHLSTKEFQSRRQAYAGDVKGMEEVLVAVNDTLEKCYFDRVRKVSPGFIEAVRKFDHDRSARESTTIGSDEDESSATGVDPFRNCKTALSSGRQTGSVEWRKQRGELGENLLEHGPTHADTVFVDLMPKEGEEMSEVQILADDNAVYGLEVMWCSGETCRKACAMSSSPHGKPTAHALVIDKGESITEVVGRCGSWVDFLKIRTSSGREISAGGNGGAEFSIVKGDEGKRVIGFRVGYGGHMHSIGAYTAALADPGRRDAAKDVMKELFTRYVEEGMDQNAAAAKALLETKRRLTRGQ